MLYQPNRLMLFLPLAHCFARYINTWRLADKAWSAICLEPSICSPICAVSNRRICLACHVCSKKCTTLPRRRPVRVFAAGSSPRRSIISCNGPRTSRTGTSFDGGPSRAFLLHVRRRQVHSFRAWSEPEISGMRRRPAERRPCPLLQWHGWHHVHSGVRYDGNRGSDDRQLAKCESRRFRW